MVKANEGKVAISKFVIGPFSLATLPKALEERIENVASVFAEIESRPASKWVEDFQRDVNPEKEIALWEVMAATYSLFTLGRDLSIDAKKEAFGLILQRSIADSKTVLNHLQLVYLSRKNTKEILRYFLQVAHARGVEV